MGAAILFTSLQLRLAAILFPANQVMCDWLNHTTWFHYNQALPCSMEFESMLLHFFYIIQSPICYVGCLMIAITWIYIFLYLRNTAILENKKSLYFLVSTCEHLWPSPSHLVNFSNWIICNIFTGFVRTFCTVFFKVYQISKSFKKNLPLVIYFGCE